jgi:crotonobetainyl-CoA:carnitine CoA-transferase CaiB-like acyl-CoA transferase
MSAHHSPQPNGQRPLEGIRVLDFTRVLSGPHCTRMLSDLGADVIKLEPPEGDLTRFAFPRVGSMSTYFAQQNIGKKNISMDLKQPEAIASIKQLVEHCDIVVENFRAGVMDKLGIGYEVLSAINPRIIYAAISGYGNSGPWMHRRAYASVVNAETGLTGLQANARGGDLTNDPHSHADVYTGMEMASAILAALYQRTNSKTGQYIDVSMAQTMLYVNEHVQNELFDRPVPAGQIRSFQPGDYPVLQTADGRNVVVSGHPAERGTFDLFVTAMNRPELLTDPRFTDVETRLKNFEEFSTIIREWAATISDPDALERIMDVAGLAMGTLRTMDELSHTDWAAERNVIIDADDRSGSTIRVPNSPWMFSGSDTSTRGVPKFRGEDNAEVFTSLLGISPEEVERLTQAGVLSIRLPKTS